MSPASRGMSADVRRPYLASIAVAALMVGQLVASRALRDGFFLTHFESTSLPAMMVVSALFSVSVVLGSSRLLRHVAPARSLPAILAASAALFLVEWAVARTAPRVAAVMVYLHIMSLSAVAFSGFWSVVNERFDPYMAKRLMARITGGASLGGVLGGVAAWWGASVVSIPTMILVVGVLNGACAAGVLVIGPGHQESSASDDAPGSAFTILRETPYLQHLLGLVALTAFGQAAYDYVFKATAAASFDSGAELVSFFALFYMLLNVVTLFVQNLASGPVLRRFGLSVTAGVLPGTSIALGVVTLAFPGLASAAAMRGGIGVAENSLFRSGYELLYTPVLPEKKRPTKALIDVGGDKVGTAIGGGAALLVLAVVPAIAMPTLVMAGIASGALALWVTRQLHRGYIESLAERLRAGQIEAHDVDVVDATTELTLVQAVGARPERAAATSALASAARSADPALGVAGDASLHAAGDGSFDAAGDGSFDAEAPAEAVGRTALIDRLSTTGRLGAEAGDPDPGSAAAASASAPAPVTSRQAPAASQKKPAPYRPPAPPALDPERLDESTRAIAHLRSNDPERQRSILRQASPLPRELVTATIPLIASAEMGPLAFEALRRVAPVHVGALLDAALDRGLEGAVRRRLCDLLGGVPTRRCAAGLVDLLDDDDFEIRFRAASSLLRIRRHHDGLDLPEARLYAVAEREAAASVRLWVARTSLDPRISDRSPQESASGQQVLHRIAFVWTVLLCVVESAGLTLAIRALASDSNAHRGTGLEYLEQVLPDSLFATLVPLFDDERLTTDGIRSRAAVLEEVAGSRSGASEDLRSLRARVDSLRVARRGP